MRSAILRVMNMHLVSPAVTVRYLVDVALTDGKAVVILICRNESVLDTGTPAEKTTNKGAHSN